MSTKRPKAASTVISQLTTANDPMPKIRDMRFALLADYPDAIPQIASWYFDEWGYLHPDSGLKDMQSKLQGSLNHDELPLLILAFENEEIMVVNKTVLYSGSLAKYRAAFFRISRSSSVRLS
jgi:hypothetical protein